MCIKYSIKLNNNLKKWKLVCIFHVILHRSQYTQTSSSSLFDFQTNTNPYTSTRIRLLLVVISIFSLAERRTALSAGRPSASIISLYMGYICIVVFDCGYNFGIENILNMDSGKLSAVICIYVRGLYYRKCACLPGH